LSIGAPNGGENLHKIQSPVVINMLHRIVEEQGFQTTPWAGQVNRKKKCQTNRSPLPATKQELRIATFSDGKIQ